jgi:hypothetical protein
MVTAIKYFGQKEKVSVPLRPPSADPQYASYRETLGFIDGVISVWEDYLDATNPRFQKLFPDIVFQAIPNLIQQPFEASPDFIIRMKAFSVQQKLFLLSTMNMDWKQAWYLDSTNFPEFWADEENWLFPQDLADILICLMQNLGSSYKPNADESGTILEVLTSSRNSYYEDLNKLKDLKSKIPIPNDERLKMWLAFQDLALTGYMEAIELMTDYFTYCQTNASLPAEPFV